MYIIHYLACLSCFYNRLPSCVVNVVTIFLENVYTSILTKSCVYKTQVQQDIKINLFYYIRRPTEYGRTDPGSFLQNKSTVLLLGVLKESNNLYRSDLMYLKQVFKDEGKINFEINKYICSFFMYHSQQVCKLF